ncbi:MAG: LD-carboxypeptidase [Fimbriimonadaceae bacterium]
MTKPRPLAKGDQVRVVSPASPVERAKLDRGIALLEGQGYRVTLGKHALAAEGYLAGTDEQRASDLNEAFADPDVAGIVCSRGGYGCARLFPWLDLDACAASRKLFCGFSDLTTLHLALNRRGLGTAHTPMLLTMSVDREPWVAESFLRLLAGSDPLAVASPRATTVVPGAMEGTLTGGCLCLICDSIGTEDAIDANGKILVIEDVDEAPHRVDAMLTHLLNAGIAQRAAGIVVGEMTRTDERADPTIGAAPWREIVAERLGRLGCPLVIDFPIGHAANQLSIPLGVRARLDADAGSLALTEPLCAH